MTEFKDFPCAIEADRCPNKQVNMFSCHGSMREECYVNWVSADPEDLEPYEVYLEELRLAGKYRG